LDLAAIPDYEWRRSLLNWAKRVEIIHGIAMGIKCLHDGKVTHRDLKPANILLDDTFRPKIADFGTAKPYIDKPSTLTLVQTAYDHHRKLKSSTFHSNSLKSIASYRIYSDIQLEHEPLEQYIYSFTACRLP
jgi:serine/threonine protein kinase